MYYVDVEQQYWVLLALRECWVFVILDFKWKSNIWQQYDPHLIIFQCQTKDIGSVSGDGSSMRNKFGDSEIFMLQNLVHQECRNGVITENKLRKIYGDIFPMVCVHKSLLAWWEQVVCTLNCKYLSFLLASCIKTNLFCNLIKVNISIEWNGVVKLTWENKISSQSRNLHFSSSCHCNCNAMQCFLWRPKTIIEFQSYHTYNGSQLQCIHIPHLPFDKSYKSNLNFAGKCSQICPINI